MPSIFDSFRSVPLLGDTIDEISGKKGLDTAAQGARDAQTQAQALSQLQWQRQMQGLGEARGQTQPYLSLYDKIYGTQTAGHVTPVGGLGMGGQATAAGTPQSPFRSFGPDINGAVGAGWNMINDAVAKAANAQRPPIMRGSPPAPGTPPRGQPANMAPPGGALSLQQLLSNALGPRGMG